MSRSELYAELEEGLVTLEGQMRGIQGSMREIAKALHHLAARLDELTDGMEKARVAGLPPNQPR